MAISAKFEADYTQFLSETKKAEASLKSLESGSQQVATSLKVVAAEGQAATSVLSGVAAQMAGAFSVGAIIAFGNEVLNVGDQIQKMSDQTGLSTEQVQRLNYVAGQSGTSMEALVSAVQNLQARLGDETSGAAGALKKLNINFETFKALNPYDQMITLATSIQAIRDPTEQASVSAAFFGKTWKEILPAIKSGMEDVARQAPVMADATVKSLDRVGDALKAAKQQATVWGGGLVLAFEQVGFAVGDFLSTFNPEHFGVANSALLEIEGHLNDPDGMKGALAKIPPLVLKVSEAFTGVKMSVKDVAQAEHDLEVSAKASAEATTKAWAETLKEVKKLEADRVDSATIGLLGLSKMEQDLSQKRMDAAVRGIDQIEKAEADLNDFIAKDSLDTASYQIVQIWRAADAKVAAFKGTTEQLAQYTAQVMDLAAREANAVVYEADRVLTTVTEKAVGAARAVQLAIEQVTAGQAVDVVANRLAAGVTGVGMQAPIYVSPPIFARASGGPVNAGQSYMVGERGPELFRPSTNGSIIPNGGATIVNNFYVNGTAEDVAKNIAKQLKRLVFDGVKVRA